MYLEKSNNENILNLKMIYISKNLNNFGFVTQKLIKTRLYVRGVYRPSLLQIYLEKLSLVNISAFLPF